MKLILTADVPGLGTPGEVVEVRDGYGRNYLVPQHMAVVATKGAEKQIATIKRARSAREIRGGEHANEVRTALEKLTVELAARATADGTKLFGSVTTVDIASAVKAAGGPVIDKRTITTDGHIRTTGKHVVSVALHPEVTATITLKVVAAH